MFTHVDPKDLIVRRSALTTATASLAVLALLAGCGDSDADPGTESQATDGETDGDSGDSEQSDIETEPDEASIAALDAVSGDWTSGEEPELSFDTPFEVNAPIARLFAEGDGDTLETGDVITMNFVTLGGIDGTNYGSNYDTNGEIISLGDGSLWPALDDVLIGASVGSQVLFAVPQGEESVLMGIEVTDIVPTRAEGTEVQTDDASLPSVALDDSGAPSITTVDADPPSELVTQPLIEGDGPVVEEGQNVLVQYTGWLWDGTQFDSSWERDAPFTAVVGEEGTVIEGWSQGLVGQTVGSQVLLVIPPDLGYGDEDTSSIPGGSTLIFVVDILHAG